MRRFLLPLVSLLWVGCGDDSSSGGAGAGPSGGSPAEGGGGAAAGGAPAGGAPAGGGGVGGSGGSPEVCPDTNIPEENLGTGADPEAGDFTMGEALDGLPAGPGPLKAIFGTALGEIACELFPEIAPNGVANFVGLARGRRPWKDGASWVKGKRYFDGIIFHRVIDDFMAQGGDPLGTGFGGPGYSFADEIGAVESHTGGTLSYANSGPNTNGSQFFIVAETGATFLDGDYVIFGRCAPLNVVKAITEVETNANDKPLDPIPMTVRISRCE